MSGRGLTTRRGVVPDGPVDRPAHPSVVLIWGDTPLAPRERGAAPLDSREDGQAGRRG